MQRPRRRRASRLSLILLGVLIVFLLAGGVATYKTLSFVGNVSTAGLGDNIRSLVTTSLPSGAAAKLGQTKPALNQRVNVLLMGYGGSGHDGAYLTDSMMVLSYDPATKKAAMISVPRDIWVRIPTDGNQGGFWKISTAYTIGMDGQSFPNKLAQFKGGMAGGGNLASYVVGAILGLKIDYWVGVDFHAFQSMVDALGGVDVNVQTAFTDYRYPRNDNPKIDASYMTIHFNAGPQHMN
ncbi:MAG: LCP family protein, partial [Chloroflexota bacterium]